jgi:hypothetical protein
MEDPDWREMTETVGDREGGAEKNMPWSDDDDIPLFATSVPAGGLTAGLQAIAALIDEEETTAASNGHGSFPAAGSRKRKAASLGTVQVHLALASCQQETQRRRLGFNPSSPTLREDVELQVSRPRRRHPRDEETSS